MTDIFLGFLNRSLAAGILILAVVLVRLVFKKAPRWLLCALWALAAVRLVCPVSIESVLSLIPSAKPVQPEIIVSAQPPSRAASRRSTRSSIPRWPRRSRPAPRRARTRCRSGRSSLRASGWPGSRRCCSTRPSPPCSCGCACARRCGWRGRCTSRSSSPRRSSSACSARAFICPTGWNRTRRRWCLRMSARICGAATQLWKPLGYLILTAYWFNPVCWLAYILFCRDIEAACDEKVVRELGEGCKAAYSRALLACSVPRKLITACPARPSARRGSNLALNLS